MSAGTVSADEQAVAPSRTRVRKRILLSSFACSPQWGSESGVGWQWFLQLARQYDVVLLTHDYFRAHLEPALTEAGLRNVEVHYVEASALGAHPHRQLNSWVYYIWWQWRLRRYVQRLLQRDRFDLIHHLTWGTLRFPCFLGNLGVPLAMGPLGGGEVAPLRLFDGLPLKIRMFDYVRSATLLWVKVDPLARFGPHRSAIILCRSEDTLRALPRSVHARAVVKPEIGSPTVHPRERTSGDPSAPAARRLLFAGRLLGWKGVALAVGAVTHLVNSGLDVELEIAGEGPLRSYLAAEIERRGLSSRVRLLGVLPREALMALYSRADLFVFPSLHDSSGSVVLEALSRGLPVICLDLGGPQHYVDASCGHVVSTEGRSRDAVERALADAIASILRSPERLAALSIGAERHALRQTWQATVEASYSAIHQRLDWVDA